MSDVFIVPFRVSPADTTIMPAGATGAYVSCYAAGSGYEEAVGKCLAALSRDGMKAEEVLQPINAMNERDWSTHIAAQWPDHASDLPDQATFEASMADGRVVYGPLGTF